MQALDTATDHKKYLRFADKAVGFRSKRVLEIGGCSPPSLIASFRPKVWTCVNLDEGAVNRFNQECSRLGMTDWSAIHADVATTNFQKQFDLVYSINSFEHISNLAQTLQQIENALVPGGRLFTIFGPIWSSDVGHHLSVPTPDGRGLHYFDGVLEPWEHLRRNRQEVFNKLAREHGMETATRAVQYIYDYGDINRLSESDYCLLIARSNLSPVLTYKKKSRIAEPKIAIASRTREILWILKLGRPSLFERFGSVARFCWAAFSFALAR